MAMEPQAPRAGLVARATAVLLRPGRVWAEIEAESIPPREMFFGYAARLAAIPAVCGSLGVLVFGFNIANVGMRPSFVGTILEAAANYVLGLAIIWLLATTIDLLAPAFGGERDRRRAFRLVAYSATAWWLAGVFYLYPSLSIPAGVLAGLYSLYTLYLGLPRMTRVPADRALTFYAVILIVLMILGIVRGAIASQAAELGGPLSMA